MTRVLLFIFLFFVVSGLGVHSFYRSLRLRIKGRLTTGKVSRLKPKPNFRGHNTIFVEFEAENNDKEKCKIEFQARETFETTAYWTGTSVPVLYNPEKPTDAIIATWDMMWLHPITMGILSVLLILGLFVLKSR